MIDGASQTPALATKAGNEAAVDRPVTGRPDTDIKYPLQAGVPPNAPDRRILAASGPPCHTFIENSKY
jgi:hypothetical protein